MRWLVLSAGLLLTTPAYADMYPDASNAKLPEALDNLKTPVAYIEAYRLPGDSPTDDTALVQRACDAVKGQNGAVWFAAKQYNIGTVTLGTEGQRYKCDLIGAAWNGDVGKTTPGGTYLKLLAGINSNMLVVPTTAPPIEMRNLWLDGNRANNTCASGSTAVIAFPDYAGPDAKARSGNLHNIRIDNACRWGMYAGYIRNAGVLDHIVVLDSVSNALTFGSNSDWRIIASDIGSAGGAALQCSGCGSLTSLGSNYFTSVNGVKVDSTALDVTFIGGSIDTNYHDGLVLVGAPGASTPFVRNFIGVRFNQNGIETNNTYADIKLVDERNAAFINPYFLKGSPAGTGGKYEQYLVNADATSRYLWQGAVYARDAAQKPFVTAALNDATRAYGTVPTVVCRSVANAAHTGTVAETVIATCPIPANTIQNGQRFEMKVGWSFSASANNKIMRARLGAAGAGVAGTTIGQQTVATGGSVALRCDSEFVADGAASQKIGPIPCGDGIVSATAYTAGAVNLAADAEVVLTGELAVAGENITLQSYAGTLYP